MPARTLAWLVPAAVVLALATAGSASAASYKTIGPASLQSFVGNWSPPDKPLCAVLQSQADWDKVFHPAPTMGANAPFSPPGLDWSRSAVLVVARVIGAGDTSRVFHLTAVKTTATATEVDYGFTPTPPASSTMKWYLAVIAPKPVAAPIAFKENGKTVCRLDPAKGVWASPAP